VAAALLDTVALRSDASSKEIGVDRFNFQARVQTIGGSTFVRLPQPDSSRLPSRGQVSVVGALNGLSYRTVLEPDGRSGHWMRIPADLEAAAGVAAGETASVEVELAGQWPGPMVPADLEQALGSAPDEVGRAWGDITPMARWEWVRWVGATRGSETRRRRVEVTISKLADGKRRPCCFDLSACTAPQL
jgi:hypothetical protein